MKRFILLLALTALILGAGGAAAATIGLGAFGGSNVAIIQQDNKGGSIFGARVPISLISFFTVEPYYATSSGGTLSDVFGDPGSPAYTRSGYDLKAFGANLDLGSPVGSAGFKFFPYVGIGSNKMTRVGSDDIKEVGYNFGLGIGGGFTQNIAVVFRGGINMVKTGDTSRKYGELTANLYYNLFRSK